MDKCSLCQNDILEGPGLELTGPDGERLTMPETAEPSVVAETSVGELTICERCLTTLPEYLLPEDLFEIYYEFGLEYGHREMHEQSANVLRTALSLQKTADALAALAVAEGYLGHTNEAVALYQHALQIEPDHFISKENLKLIKKEANKGIDGD